MNNYVINISGGAGKNLLFSSVAKNVKESFPNHELVVVSPYPELLINNPVFYRVYRAGSAPYLKEDFLSGEGCIASSIEPYGDGAFLLEREHITQTWSRLLNSTPNLLKPDLFLTFREIQAAKNQLFTDIFNLAGGKPIAVIQPFGGPTGQQFGYNWNRDIPPSQADKLVNILINEGYFVVQVARQDQIAASGAYKFSGSLREIACLLQLADKRILIDSFCQHAAAALNLPSTVLWITNSPKVFGHPIHKNIKPSNKALENSNFYHQIDSVFQDHNWDGSWNHYYPFEDDNIFNLDEVVDSLNLKN
jgi:hypothetical protein